MTVPLARLNAGRYKGFVRRAGILLLLLAAVAQSEGERPNFVVFLTDDLGYGDLACYGHPLIRSPSLDRFAKEGLKLTQCYAACPVCSPSRSAILTGRTPYRNGVFSWIPAGSFLHLRRSELTIARILKGLGYETCHVGKWHLNGKFNSPEQPQPGDHGYDWWLATQNNAAPSHENTRNFVRNGKEVGPLEGYSAPLIVEEAVGWLQRRRDRRKPFFLAVWTHEPHLPIESAPKYRAQYEPQSKDAGLVQHHANVTQIDDAFGRLMTALDELELRKNTLVFFTSDNGPEGDGKRRRTRGSTGGLRGRKRAVYEGGIRVPGLVRWPGRVRPGTTSAEPVIGSDIFATIVSILQVDLPADRTFDGASLLPLFEGKEVPRTVPLFWRWDGAPHGLHMALRRGNYKVLAARDLSRFELYDLARDPAERNDLATARPELFSSMKAALLRHNAAVEAEGPDWWKGYFPGGPPGKGKDETGAFDVVRGCTVKRSELGFELRARQEGFAVHRLKKPVTGRATFRLRYRTLVKTPTRNACLVFGQKSTNAALVKAGTAIGMGAHVLFPGPWSRLQSGRVLRKDFDKNKTFLLEVVVDLAKRTVTATVDGARLEAKLPAGLKAIDYYGYYVKGTRSEFSAIELDR